VPPLAPPWTRSPGVASMGLKSDSLTRIVCISIIRRLTTLEIASQLLHVGHTTQAADSTFQPNNLSILNATKACFRPPKRVFEESNVQNTSPQPPAKRRFIAPDIDFDAFDGVKYSSNLPKTSFKVADWTDDRLFACFKAIHHYGLLQSMADLLQYEDLLNQCIINPITRR
jgi:hypothetical protein